MRRNLGADLRARFRHASAYRSWTIEANDGVIATAGLLFGFAGAGASNRMLLFTAAQLEWEYSFDEPMPPVSSCCEPFAEARRHDDRAKVMWVTPLGLDVASTS